MPHILDEVLTTDAVRKLQKNDLLSENIDDLAYWKIQPTLFPMIFPHIRFHNGKIPWAYNMPTFLSYLGFSVPVAVRLYQSVAEMSNPTRTSLLERAKAHIKSKWASSNYNGAVPGSMLAEAVMGEMDLIDQVKAEVTALYHLFLHNASVFQRYFDANHDKNYENLKLVDFIIELQHQRMMKLMSLNQAAIQYLR